MESGEEQHILDLPAEIILRICSFLNCLDIVHCCTVFPTWCQALCSPVGISIFRKEFASWTWLDQRLSRLVLSSCTSLSAFTDMLGALSYRDEQNMIFHRSWASFTLPDGTENIECLLLGPAVDANGLFPGFFSVLLTSMDTRASVDQIRLPKRRGLSNLGWTGHGIPIRIPMSGKNNTSGQMHINITTLHARDKASRELQSSRTDGSFIIKNSQLTSKARTMINAADFVLYAVDCRRGRSDWDDIRRELTELALALTPCQTLVVLGLCGVFDNNRNELVSAVEIVQNLGGVDDGPLAVAKTNWRVWCVMSDGQQYTNLNEIFQWAYIDFVSKPANCNHDNQRSSGGLSRVWNLLSKWF
uniref:F-box domain-containing protein n=1 Tax=Mesocestoides corti TaxID=53468 RepID=A0A5K3EI69_MESCO